MALEIKPAPVLSGKFYKSLKHAKESKSTEEVQEIAREVRAFMAKQNKLR
jgi:hypothetical protein